MKTDSLGRMWRTFNFFGILFTSFCCLMPKAIHSQGTISKRMQVWDKLMLFEGHTVIEEEVTIMPQAYITTKKGASITFKKRVNILGYSKVFDDVLDLNFNGGTMSDFNVTWFGATGYDSQDDTDAFKRTLDVSLSYPGVVNILIPNGRYFISQTLVVIGELESRKPINFRGEGMSVNGIQGSSLSWTGASEGELLRFSNTGQFVIEKLDFTSEPNHLLKHNITFAPFLHAATIQYCSFSGTAGDGASNININDGNGDQVSEIRIEKCSFNGMAPGGDKMSMSAIRGGLANTKNFYIRDCGFNQYEKAAIDILNTEVLMVEGCTFSNNQLDISCSLCGTYVAGNFSEHSKSFFSSGFSANISFNTLINNYFIGQPESGWIIPDGSGSLVMINNDFGGADQRGENNRVRWEENPFSAIYSIGNFYKNASPEVPPFFNRSGQPRHRNVFSAGDMGGTNADGRKALIPMGQPANH